MRGNRAVGYGKIPEEFLRKVQQFSSRCEEWLEEHREDSKRKLVLPLWFEVRFFLRIAELYGPEYVTQLFHKGSEVRIRLFCMDPARFLDEALSKGRAGILFSATLSPLSYFVSVIGGGENPKTLAVPSPFPPENFFLLLADRVSTRYVDRENSLPEVARLIGSFASAGKGNYIAYFPSYEYMEKARNQVQEEYPQLQIVSQARSMSEEEREAFLVAVFGRKRRNAAGLLRDGRYFFGGNRLLR